MLSKETILQNAIQFSTGQTDYQNENFVMNSHVTKYRQIRQALLEIENRYHGLRKKFYAADIKHSSLLCHTDFDKEKKVLLLQNIFLCQSECDIES